MSQPAASQDSFVPFDTEAGRQAGRPAGRISPLPAIRSAGPPVEAGSAFTPLAHGPAGSTAHGKPAVSLQREGDRVTGIRIECVCGQVIELSCSYSP
jgi:hypothetical protein